VTALQIDDATYALTPDGRLANLSAWNEDVAYALAANEGIELTDAHWEILCVMRLFYQEFNTAPGRKLLKRAVIERLGLDKALDQYLDALFPDSVEIQGTRIAGIPVPVVDTDIEDLAFLTRPVQDPVTSPRFITQFEFEGVTYRIYPNGNLVDPRQWNERIAQYLAEQEDLTLGPEHWQVIHFLREFYFEYGISPMVRLLMKHMEDQFGPAKSSEEYLYTLFPGGPSRQGSRIAGLPEPQGCIDP
jgi:tRNA 2-thiouridine synthesizing protein E